MARKSLTFYKLISPYSEDVTKNCGLVGQEIDSNFLNLKEMDIETVSVDGCKIILKRVDGEELVADLSPVLNDVTTKFSVSYDKEEGTILINHNGTQDVISGLITEDNLDYFALQEVTSNSTLFGKGNYKFPLGISPVERTSALAMAKRLVDMTDGVTKLPCPSTCRKGDRYVTRENVDDFGYLYNFAAVKKIQNDLDMEGHGWRIPTKADWDNMLNAIEPCDEYKNHGNINGNIQSGKYAGKFLKSKNYWKLYSTVSTCNTYTSSDVITNYNPCYPCNPCDSGTTTTPCPPKIDPNGSDSFGLGLVPAGYGDGCQLNGYFLERAMYWTSSVSHVTDVYVKRFDYDKATVIQEIVSQNTIASIRLVKDYDGTNHLDTENILGQDYHTVLLPSENSSNGFQIWTDVNVSFNNCEYCPVLPNNGLDVPVESKYPSFYLNEWMGFSWLKREIREGETVVLKTGLNGESFVEYRLQQGELVDTANEVYTEVVENFDVVVKDLQSQIDETNDNLNTLNNKVNANTNSIVALNDALEAEKTDRITADNNLLNLINTNKDENQASLNELRDLIAREETERKQQDVALQDQIYLESTARREADEALSQSISNLSATTSAQYEELKNSIAEETAKRQEADNRLQNEINTTNQKLQEETERATTEEGKLNERIDNVNESLTTSINNINKNVSDGFATINEAMTNGFNTINAAIEAERQIRSSADEELSKKIDNLDKRIEEELVDIESKFKEDIENLSGAINTEVARATKREQEILNKLNNEIDERKKSDVEQEKKLQEEIDRAKAEESRLNGRLISKEGCSIDWKKGVITLATEDSANTITLSFNSNFGNF